MSPAVRFVAAALLVGAAVAAGGCDGSAPGVVAGAKPYRVAIDVPGVYREQPAALKAGEVLRVTTTGVIVGEIESVESTPSAVQITTPDGRTIVAPSPVYLDMRVTVLGQARETAAGPVFPGGALSRKPGAEFMTPRSYFTGTVVSVEAAGP